MFRRSRSLGPRSQQRNGGSTANNAAPPDAAWDVVSSANSSNDDAREEEATPDELRRIIAGLRISVMTHADSSAESAEHLTRLRLAHDNLYREHVNLQEQMDDAVELLKYLKDEKANYEDKLRCLTNENNVLKNMSEGDVVSMTIAQLTKEKMNLEARLLAEKEHGNASATNDNNNNNNNNNNGAGDTEPDSRKTAEVINKLQVKNDELLNTIDMLQKAQINSTAEIENLQQMKVVYDAQSQLRAMDENSVATLTKENDELRKRVELLERSKKNIENASQGKDVMHTQRLGEYENILQAKMEELESALSARNEFRDELHMTRMLLESEREESITERKAIEAERMVLIEKHNSIAAQREELRLTKIEIETMQRGEQHHTKALSSSSSSSRDAEDDDGNRHESLIESLEQTNQKLVKEGDDMKLYVQALKNSLEKKDEEYESVENELRQQLTVLQEQVTLYQQQFQLVTLEEANVDGESEFHTERMELQQQLAALHGRVDVYQRQVFELQMQTQEYQRKEVTWHEQKDGYQRMQVKTDTKIKELQEQLVKHGDRRPSIGSSSSSHSHASLKATVTTSQQQQQQQQYPDDLEKEMQERLSKRIAVQLHDAKLAMEAQIREELEAEYAAARSGGDVNSEYYSPDDGQDEEEQLENESTSKSISELENTLRRQLSQAKADQTDLLAKVKESQKQFLTVREEFKKKLEKERTRNRELEKEKDDQQLVIEKMLDEHQGIMAQLEELQEWEEDRVNVLQQHQQQIEELEAREEEYAIQIQQLQNDIDELVTERAAQYDEYDTLQTKHQILIKKIEKADDELQRVMDDLEKLNTENTEYAERIEAFKNASIDNEDSKVKFSVLQIEHKALQNQLSKQDELNENMVRQIEQLNIEAKELHNTTQSLEHNLTLVKKERDTLVDSLNESNEQCSQLETKLASALDSSQREDEFYEQKLEKLQNQLTQSEAATAAAILAITDKEIAIQDLVGTETKLKVSTAELQSQLSDSASQVSKLINQLSIVSGEKTTLATRLDSITEDLSVMTATANIGELQEKIDRLVTELDASKLEIVDLKTHQLDLANQQQLKEVESTAEAEIPSIAVQREVHEVNNLKDQIEMAKQQMNEAESKALQPEIDVLKTEPQTISNTNLLTPESTAAVEDLMKDLTQVNDNFQRLKREHTEEVEKLNADLSELCDKCVMLEEAVKDIQLEKEDLELENQELASKLADLTTQAKKMLLNNESLEEEIQDQQIEYEDRISELERLLADKQDHDAQLGTDTTEQNKVEKSVGDGIVEGAESSDIPELKAKNAEIVELLRFSHEQNDAAADLIEQLKAENAKLRRLISENESVKSSSQKLLTAGAHNDTTLSFDQQRELEHLKSVVSLTAIDRNTFDRRLSELTDMWGKGPSPHKRPCDAPTSPAVGTTPGFESGVASTPLTTQGPGLTCDSSVSHNTSSNVTPPPLQIVKQIEHLTNENGELAQKLGNAVAEKEFALSTLAKLGAKVEELMERNRLLSDPDSKSHSQRLLHQRRLLKNDVRRSSDERGRDPDVVIVDAGRSSSSSPYSYPTDLAITKYQHSSAGGNDEATTASEMESTIRSYGFEQQTTKPREPESASELGNPGRWPSSYSHPMEHNDGNSKRNYPNSNSSRRTHCVESLDEVRSVKVNGGNYVGSVNDRGQKHGYGKMTYDNGNEYDGEWKYNKRDGKGSTKYNSGNLYTGTWKAGKRHGFGVFHIKKTGDIYRGNWEHGLKSGAGVYEYEDGELDVSYYREDVRVGEGVRWSVSRHKASRLIDGQLVGEEGDMPLVDAIKLTKDLGFIV